MKKSGGTLFSYFQPVQEKQAAGGKASGNAAKKPQKTPLSNKSRNSKPKTSPPSQKKPRKSQNNGVLIGGSTPVESGQLVWAKMDGHPWWPALVCLHPTTQKMVRGKKAPEAHVQFFGKPPTRGWVAVKSIEILNEATLGAHTGNEEGFDEAVQQSREAIQLSPEGRLELVVDIPSEASEDEQENIEPMDATPSGRKRPRLQTESEEDSDSEIGVGKNLASRPKRAAAMSIAERKRTKKRVKRALDSSGSEDEYCPGVDGGSSESEECSSGDEEEEEGNESAPTSEGEGESIVTPAKKRKTAAKAFTTPKTPSTFRKTSTPGSAIKTTPVTPSPSPSLPATPLLGHAGPFQHEKLDWLKEDKRRDKDGRTMNDPDYNPRTLLIPGEYIRKLTPGVRQWWTIKSTNFDTILMFKVGKFYELYHMDAVVGVRELGLVFMKGEFAHSGFPEIAFGRYAQTLVQKGYKVARIEQTETPQMMEQRVKNMSGPTKFDRVVRRELCSVVTKGTRTLSFFDGGVGDSESAFLLAIKEKDGSSPGESMYGVCFVDTCIGKFHLGEFSDDRQCSRLRTIIAHYPPAQVLFERNNLSSKTQTVVKQLLANTIRDCLAPDKEFWSSGKTLKTLAEGNYFSEDKDSIEFEWPETLKSMLAEDDSLGLTAGDGYEQAISALGACVWCLTHCCIEHQLLSLRTFEYYRPLDVRSGEREKPAGTLSASFARQRMILDDITLTNLDVLDNHGKTAGTLLEKLDHCVTPFGKRLIKQWLCAPLCHPEAINERLDAVTDLMKHASVVGETKDILKTMPDLERLLRKIHTLGSAVQSQEHPDGRAILYEQITYSRRKILDFIAVLDGFQASLNVMGVFRQVADSLSSKLLKKITSLPNNGGVFPDMAEQLQFFQTSFDHAKAKKDGVILPSKGVNEDYDSALREIQVSKNKLDEYLQRQRKRLGCKTIVYWGSGRNRYQLEVPELALARHTPDDYELKSQKKGFRRYWTREIEEMLEKLTSAEEKRDSALKDTMRALFHSFGEHFKLWESAVHCLAVLDALLALATYSSCSEGEMCRPQIVLSPTPFLDIRSSRHPCISQTYSGDDFIPNDVIINGEDPPNGRMCLVVTGPNMGGKSTLMRQTGLLVILAQMGCYVPAESCRFSTVDRVFTRLGASDRIMSGESTFLVELTETATILQHTSPHSLVLLDELGRGTATYDGTAIAWAVVRELAERLQCRTLFSTHYHSLVEELGRNPNVQLGHMACMVEGEGEEGGDEETMETITFLYKFVEGACPKSYGFNAARLAGIPSEVIHVARKKAQEFERSTNQLQVFRKLMSPTLQSDQLPWLQGQITTLY